jgi:hypothetical protein
MARIDRRIAELQDRLTRDTIQHILNFIMIIILHILHFLHSASFMLGWPLCNPGPYDVIPSYDYSS